MDIKKINSYKTNQMCHRHIHKLYKTKKFIFNSYIYVCNKLTAT